MDEFTSFHCPSDAGHLILLKIDQIVSGMPSIPVLQKIGRSPRDFVHTCELGRISNAPTGETALYHRVAAPLSQPLGAQASCCAEPAWREMRGVFSWPLSVPNAANFRQMMCQRDRHRSRWEFRLGIPPSEERESASKVISLFSTVIF
jgi:hypothetical protein